LVQGVIAIVLLVVAIGVAWWLERRRRPAPVRTNAPVPPQLERTDFPRPDAPWLVVIFSSSTCEGCAPMAEKVRALESNDVAVADVEYHEQRALHDRYGIEAVPIVVVVDDKGVTRKSFAGNATATDLWAAVAEVRDGV
jgi:thiol-disulfide isomerase/thioredoxin